MNGACAHVFDFSNQLFARFEPKLNALPNLTLQNGPHGVGRFKLERTLRKGGGGDSDDGQNKGDGFHCGAVVAFASVSQAFGTLRLFQLGRRK